MIKKFVKKLLKKEEKITIPSDVVIGENCVVMSRVNFGSEPYLVRIGNNVRIAEEVSFFTHDGGAWVLRNLHILDDADFFGPIRVGNNVHIGMGAIIMPNVTIGDNCIIGVRAVVTKDVPSNSVVAGMPARVIETIGEYYEKHKDSCDFTKHMPPKEKKEYLKRKYHDKEK